MPLTEKQLAANRANAQKSTGPKTPGGKHNSALNSRNSGNSTNHGFLATSILLPGESRERFLELLSALITEFLPETTNEMALVETMVIALWRLRRLWTLEAAIIIYEQRRQAESTLQENAPTRTMLAILALTPAQRESMSRDEARYDRQYHRAIRTLLRLQEERRRKATN